ncbi:MAG: glycosyltransferase family 4 protein [Gammaproteobacteria bacterium]|nr:glycosyltransferase family 4 protein [Gammaproteobacteria bacterium]
MKLAVCLYKFFPFGGLARDFLSIMTICRDHGYEVDVYVMEWHGNVPDGFNIHIVSTRGWTNHGKVDSFIKQITPQLQNNYDLVIGFNKMPGLDLYYAADPCYLDRVKNQKTYFFDKFGGRLQFYVKCERAVFGAESKTVSLMISDVQRDLFKKHYATPAERMIMLPPGIDKDRRRPENWNEIRQEFRHEFNVSNDEFVILMVGTGFKTKGVDRAINGLATIPQALRDKIKLFVVGEGNARPYQKLARQLSVREHVQFFGGRTDIPRFLIGADLLVHPARKENTGTVILEAMVAGLPVLVSDVCGYAKHVTKSDAGLIVPSPFHQQKFSRQLTEMLQADRLQQWSDKGLEYAASEDLYSMPEKAAQIIECMAKDNKHAGFAG